MKRYKKIYILSGILIFGCILTFGVSRYEQKKEEIKNSDEVIMEVSEDDVTALSWEYDDTKLAFHKDEKWLYDDDENFPVSEEKVSSLLELFESFGVSFIIENVEDYAQYGLDNPECTINIETEDKTYEVKLGDFSTMDEQRYVSIGDGNVYLVSEDPMESYEIELKDMILNDETPNIEQAQSMSIAGVDDYKVTYQKESDKTYDEDDVYFVEEGDTTLALDTDTVENYFTTIHNLNLNDYVTYHATEEELKTYGLDNPELTATIQYTPKDDEENDGDDKEDTEESQTFVIHVSRSAEEKEKAKKEEKSKENEDTSDEDDSDSEENSIPAYVRIGDSSIIYEITEEEYDSLLAVSRNDLRHQVIFWAGFDKVTEVDISLEEKKYKLTSKEKKKETIWYYGEDEITIDDFSSALVSLTAKEFKEDEISGKKEISLTVHLDDENYPTVQIDLYRQDGDSCLAVVDGKVIALVQRSKVVDLIEAVNAIVLN